MTNDGAESARAAAHADGGDGARLAGGASGVRAIRFDGLDAARFWASIAIIWLHTVEAPSIARTDVIGRFAVPFFTAAAVWLIAVKLRDQSPKRVLGVADLLGYASQRIRRLYVPFLVWSAIYLAVRYASRVVFKSDEPLLDWNFPLAGSTHHLWFLPFITVATIAAYPTLRIAKAFGAAPAGRAWCLVAAVLAAVAGVLVAQSDFPAIDPFYPMLRIWAALPALCWGWGLAVLTVSGLFFRDNTFRPAPLLLLVALACTILLYAWRDTVLLENCAGFALLLGVVAPPTPRWAGPFAKLGDLAFTIYLAHILFIEGAQKILHRVHPEPAVWIDLSVFAIAVVLSVAAALAIKRSHARAFLGA